MANGRTEKANALVQLNEEINRVCTIKAREEFEAHREFYPSQDGWEESQWYCEETGEHQTQEEANNWIEEKTTEMIKELTPTLVQTAMDNC